MVDSQDSSNIKNVVIIKIKIHHSELCDQEKQLTWQLLAKFNMKLEAKNLNVFLKYYSLLNAYYNKEMLSKLPSNWSCTYIFTISN